LFLNTGSWHEQGLPWYGGVLEYRQRVDIPPEWQGCRVFLELAAMRDAVEVWIDSRLCGQAVAPPYRFDVTTLMEPGLPVDVRLLISNTASAAVLGLDETTPPAGLLGPARLVAYPNVEILTTVAAAANARTGSQ
jgi:hypothetical protein